MEFVHVLVTTYDPDREEPAQRLIDHNNKEHRVWLGKHCFWAMRSGVTVSTKPLTKQEADDFRNRTKGHANV